MSMFSIASSNGTPALGDRRLKGIEIHRHQIDRHDAALAERGQVLGQVPPGEQRAVDGRVQRLDPAVEQLGEAGDLRPPG